MLICKKLSYIHEGKTILKDVDFSIGKGQVGVLIGLSGSGKSTLLDCIGNYKKYSGVVSTELNFRYIKELPELCQSLIGYDYLEMLLSMRNEDFKKYIYSLVNSIGIFKELEKEIKDTCLYTQRILVLLSAICLDCETIILDDPFRNLDHESQMKMIGLIKHLKEQNKTLLISTNQLGFGFEIADILLIINNGKVKQMKNLFKCVNVYEKKILHLMLK